MNNKNIKVVDEHSIDRNANVMFAFDLEGSEYVIYSIERDEDNSNIFVSKIIKNLDGTFNMLDIDDSMEKSKLSDIVKTLITTAVNDGVDKLEKTSITLSDGKVVKFLVATFNKEQRINVQKTYITTVKKEIANVAEKYFAVEVSLEEPKLFEDIFPPVSPVVEPVDNEVKDVVPEINVLDTNIPSELKEEPSLVSPVVSDPVPTVVESITITEPAANIMNPESTEILPTVPPITQEITPSVNLETNSEVVEPLVFNASKETNLNAALGEVASSASIPVENIAPIREFGVDEVVKSPVTEAPVAVAPVQPEGTAVKNAGFANNKFFMIVAVAFFLASCVFLGYEVFNYFQLTK